MWYRYVVVKTKFPNKFNGSAHTARRPLRHDSICFPKPYRAFGLRCAPATSFMVSPEVRSSLPVYKETGRYRRFIGDTHELRGTLLSRALAGNDGTVWRSIPQCDSSAVAVSTARKRSQRRIVCVRFSNFHFF
jgi:hypothetical protein